MKQTYELQNLSQKVCVYRSCTAWKYKESGAEEKVGDPTLVTPPGSPYRSDFSAKKNKCKLTSAID